MYFNIVLELLLPLKYVVFQFDHLREVPDREIAEHSHTRVFELLEAKSDVIIVFFLLLYVGSAVLYLIFQGAVELLEVA